MAPSKFARAAAMTGLVWMISPGLASHCPLGDEENATIKRRPVQVLVEQPMDISLYVPENTVFTIEEDWLLEVTDAPTTLVTHITKTSTLCTVLEETPSCAQDESFGAMKFPDQFDLINGIGMADYGCPAPHDSEKIVTVQAPGPYPTPFTVNIPDSKNEECGTVFVLTPQAVPTKPWDGPCRTLTQLWEGPEPTMYTLGPEHRGPKAVGTAIVLQPGAVRNAAVGKCGECTTLTRAVTECPTPVTLTIPPTGTNTDTTVLVIDPSATEKEGPYTTITRPLASGSEPVTVTIPPQEPGGQGAVIISELAGDYTTITRPLTSGTEAVTTTIPPSGNGGQGTVIVSEPPGQSGITTITVPNTIGDETVTTTLAPDSPGDTTTVIVSEPPGESGITTITVPNVSGSETVTVTLEPDEAGGTTTVIVSDPPGDPGVTTITVPNTVNDETITITETPDVEGGTTTVIISEPPGDAGVTTITVPNTENDETVTITLAPEEQGGTTTVIISEPPGEPGVTTITVPNTENDETITITETPDQEGGTTTVIISDPDEEPGITTITETGDVDETITTTLEPGEEGGTTTVVIVEPPITGTDDPSDTAAGDPSFVQTEGNDVNTETIPDAPTGTTQTVSTTPDLVFPIQDGTTSPGSSSSTTTDDGPTNTTGDEDPSETATESTTDNTGGGGGPSETNSSGNGDSTTAGNPPTETNTDEPDPENVPVPDRSCNNTGIQYAIYNSEFKDTDDTFSTFNATVFHDRAPLFTGVTDRIGIRRGGREPEDEFAIYADSPNFTFQYKAVDHQAYFYAPTSGEYTFRIAAADDITLFWIGSNAYYKTWTRENALIARTYHSGATEAKVRLRAGTLTPIRVLWANGQDRYDFRFTIFDPTNRAIADPNRSSDEYFIQHGCPPQGEEGAEDPPYFPPYGDQPFPPNQEANTAILL